MWLLQKKKKKQKKKNRYFSSFHRVAVTSTVSRSNWNKEMLVFGEGRKPENLETLVARTRTNNKLNPHITSIPRIEHEPHCWEASALSTAPSLLSTRRLIGRQTCSKCCTSIIRANGLCFINGFGINFSVALV